MQMTVQSRALACLATLVAGAGCVAPYPYGSPYGGYPGAYGSPGMMSPSPTLSAPVGASPTPLGSSSANSGSTDAPMFDPNAPDPNKVPDYSDPGDLPPSNNDKNMFEQGKKPFDDVDTSSNTRRGATNAAYEKEFAATPGQPPILSPIQKLSAESDAPAPSADLGVAEDDFVQPVASFADEDELTLPYEEDKVQIPYGHDAEGYRYLRGLAIYDDRTDSWSVIYNNKPGRDDEFGGVLTLVDDEGFAILNDKDVVQVNGRLSETERDEYGKAKYVVGELQKLQPIAR